MKKIIALSIGLIFISLSMVSCIFSRKYSDIIYENWGITLPKDYKELYSLNAESFFGEGPRYHIFEYKDIKLIENAFNWENEKDMTVESNIIEILKDLSIKDQYTIDFDNEYKYYTMLRKDDSQLYLIFDVSTKRIYVIENLF